MVPAVKLSCISVHVEIPPRKQIDQKAFRHDKSLICSVATTRAGLKRKLEAFEGATDEATERSAKRIAEDSDDLVAFEKLMNVVGRGCGFCFIAGVTDPKEHWMEDCPTASATQKAEFKRFKNIVRYPTDGRPGPCWRCHISTMGQNRLHPDFVARTVTCTHPNLVLPMAYAVYSEKEWNKAAVDHFKPHKSDHSWDTVEKYNKWFISKHITLGCQGMAIMKWVSERRV
jgi:hypothetical protein